MIETIPHIRAISIRRKLDTIGSEPLLIIGNDYNAYYVKNNQRLNPAVTLINEVLCHFLLKAWAINTPDIALIKVENETLERGYGPKHKKLYYDRLAFGSKEIEGAFDLTELATIKGKIDFKRLYRPEMFARIGLFDMWVENEDRPPDLKNIMLYELEERYHFLAIDNVMAFRTGAYETLTDKEFYPTENNYCLQSTFFKHFRRYLRGSERGWAKKEEENFYLCINNSKNYFSQCISLIPFEWGFTKSIQKILEEFLFNDKRNQLVFNEYIRMWRS
jgi:hypothetical protein